MLAICLRQNLNTRRTVKLERQNSMMDARLILLFTLSDHGWVSKLASQGQTISDACHGNHPPQCTNKLKCDKPPLTICILEVRYYQWNNQDGCGLTISRKANKECCSHNDNACYKLMDNHDIDKLRAECASQPTFTTGKCDLVSDNTYRVTPTCNTANGKSAFSNVRSIQYSCVQGNCPGESMITSTDATSSSIAGRTLTRHPQGTQTHQFATTKMMTTKWETTVFTTSDTKSVTYHNTSNTYRKQDQDKHNTGTVVGGVIGAIIFIGIFVAIVVFCRRRATNRAKANTTRIPDEVAEPDRPTRRPSGSTVTGFNESTGQLEGTFDRKPWTNPDNNNARYLYTKVNKKLKPGKVTEEQDSHDGYDHVPGEAAHFPVIRSGDYDHVALGSEVYSDQAANVDETNCADPSSHQDTYDKLHRFAPPTTVVVEEDTYHRLHHATAKHPK